MPIYHFDTDGHCIMRFDTQGATHDLAQAQQKALKSASYCIDDRLFLRDDIYGAPVTTVEEDAEGTVVSTTAELTVRELSHIQFDESTSSLIDLPVPCTVEINGVKYAVSDTTVVLDLSLPGKYKIKVRDGKHLAFHMVIQT